MTTPTSNQRDWSTGPRFTALPHHLLDAAEVVNVSGHQKLGVMYEVDSCSLPNQYSAVCVTGFGMEKSPSAAPVYRAADPFIVYTWLPCTFVGMEPEGLRSRTLAAHENNVTRVVDEVFWTGGDDNVYQHLSSNTEVTEVSGGNTLVVQTAATDVTPTPGTPVGVAEALGLLEGAMGDCYGGIPFIHVPRAVVALLANAHALRDELDSEGRLRTRNGSIVAAYSGPNTGPDGTDAGTGEAWMYATGAVKVWRGPVRVTAQTAAEALVRSTNETVLIAEQRFVIGWDCCHFAVLVDTTVPTA